MRLFTAIPIGEPARIQVAVLIASLREAGADFAWSDPANLHLTLSFHGSARPEQIPQIEAAMARAAAGKKAFALSFGSVGAFDSLESPRVLWIGVESGAEPIKDLAAALRSELAPEGLLSEEEKTREFRPHLTIGRRCGGKNLESLKKRLALLPRLDARSEADRIVLYESRPSPAGSRYTALREVRL